LFNVNSSENSDTFEKQTLNNEKINFKQPELVKKVTNQLKNCMTMNGFFNPAQAFECLNVISKTDNPKAYENEIELAVN
jgi:hypothetical protein